MKKGLIVVGVGMVLVGLFNNRLLMVYIMGTGLAINGFSLMRRLMR